MANVDPLFEAWLKNLDVLPQIKLYFILHKLDTDTEVDISFEGDDRRVPIKIPKDIYDKLFPEDSTHNAVRLVDVRTDMPVVIQNIIHDIPDWHIIFDKFEKLDLD